MTKKEYKLDDKIVIIPFDPDKDAIAKKAIELGANIIETLKENKEEANPLDVARIRILSDLDPKIKERYGDIITDHLSQINDVGFEKYHKTLLNRKENSTKGMYLKRVDMWDSFFDDLEP